MIYLLKHMPKPWYDRLVEAVVIAKSEADARSIVAKDDEDTRWIKDATCELVGTETGDRSDPFICQYYLRA